MLLKSFQRLGSKHRLQKYDISNGIALSCARCVTTPLAHETVTSRQIPETLLQALSTHPKLSVDRVPDAGRGLFATLPIGYGETILVERPMLCYPSHKALNMVCYSCLRLLDATADVVTSPLSGHRFCSDACVVSAESDFHAMESLTLEAKASILGSVPDINTAVSCSAQDGPQCSTSNQVVPPLSQFHDMCNAHGGERFPLMAARLAFSRLSKSLKNLPGKLELSSNPILPEGPISGHQPSQQPQSTYALQHEGPHGVKRSLSQDCGGSEQNKLICGDPCSDLDFLCYANVSKPYPVHWIDLYSLLQLAMRQAVLRVESQLLAVTGEGMAEVEGHTDGPTLQRLSALKSELEHLSLDWFVSVLARLHINVFRVSCMVPPGALIGVANASGSSSATSSSSPWSGMGAMTSGSGAFLVASLFNHSCEPNVEIVFRRNDATASFVAVRDIDKGEQLFVSYIDEAMGVQHRQDYLHFSYGFRCGCQRCIEELHDLMQK
ncbi:hypothetical protein CEUSTIGMA_g10151.t1 [Chlamydomonas eustigma]|uniref:SET domain-containing protein n=1 Tax=Chlamydomonas eustigma TaxID=1157962 RepID=A0A250XI10_9CHLO|nr:hypothetical protein CEUSTIGMA_g10151.t1 [Chlamydomonas eustigma]|eukprot:GAX82725.1 hypothetical protein CEUSTIGMA_g10151.t1 [Chlamydomonas eustigma]